MKEARSPEDWLDYSHWPGPDEIPSPLEVLREMMHYYSSPFGRIPAAFQSNHVHVRAIDFNLASEVETTQISPFAAELERKKSRSHEASKVRTYDHRGRRLY